MILLDTHIVLWWATEDRRISRPAARELSRADVLYVSPVSCWEIATLVRRDRIRLDRDAYIWIRDLLGGDRVELAPLSPEAAVGAGLLPTATFPGDPADRLLYAQARELSVPLVTKDDRLRAYAIQAGDVRTIW